MTVETASASARVADTVAKTLHAHGIRLAFGMPGGEVVTLVDALEKAGIAFNLARHETAAALMAAGAATTTATPGLLVTTVGPGLANAVNGIADASQEHVPLIVISGVVDRDTRARYTHQVIDHAAMLRPLVKASFEINEESAGPTVARALAIALAEPMGPVHLDLSPAVAAMPDRKAKAIAPPQTVLPTISPADPAIQSLAARLAAADRPLILAGFEAARHGAGTALRALAEKRCIPVITTYKGKGILSEDHPLSLGGAGLSPAADRVLLDLVRASDLLLMVGYDPIEMRLGWLDLLDDPARMIELTAAPRRSCHASRGLAPDRAGGPGNTGTGSLRFPGQQLAGRRTGQGTTGTRPAICNARQPGARMQSSMRWRRLRARTPSLPSTAGRTAFCCRRNGGQSIRCISCNRQVSAPWPPPCRWQSAQAAPTPDAASSP